MDTISEKAYAKLNLTLGVLYKRRDGYHALDSLMQTIDLCDLVTIERDNQVTVTASVATLPYNNTLRRAALAYQAYTGKGANIHLNKRIPLESGMGGGSADAAAVLRGMQQMYGALEEGELYKIALLVGADVPFCLHGGLQRAQGVGEELTRLPSCDMTFVIAKPEKGISTQQLFYMLDLPQKLPETAGAISAIASQNLEALGPLLFNALEETAVKLVPDVAIIHEKLMDAGALGAAMTGSGSTVFGLFSDAQKARKALDAVKDLASFARICKAV